MLTENFNMYWALAFEVVLKTVAVFTYEVKY